ncbi:hypothetical protein L7F22_063748 [Adiantum nelumboides]|nr:hypothetical protein [Adiantum nelumboides]
MRITTVFGSCSIHYQKQRLPFETLRTSLLQTSKSVSRLADALFIVPRPSLGFKEKGYTTKAVFASKKGNRSHKTTDSDNEEDLVTEADLQYKPVGFGQGKVYDTSLEDEILEEIELGKAAKTAVIEKQKTNDVLKNNSKIKSTSKHLETVDGVKVWVGDLPKKKNIDRDLRSAFRHVPGLLDISPVVQGNEKTRDPICKGFGFLTFDTLDNAKNFISSFQDRQLSFGKVEKKLTFRLVKANNAEAVPSLSSSHGASSSSEEDSCDESDTVEPEFEIAVEIGEFPGDNAPRPEAEVDENTDTTDAEKRIEDLERRLRKKLDDAGHGAEKSKHEENTVKAKTFKSNRIRVSKQSLPKGNNVAAVTHGLKKKERAFMTGVLEKYGNVSSSTNP